MLYYLLEISKGDEKVAGSAVYTYNSKKEAIANYHSKLGTAMKSPLYTSELVMVVDENGGVEAVHKYPEEEERN